eukprot:CAMPEP_0194315182 /NCGR_PEP_ID=MMETSP0171-20130528/11983_1 /TAXON_ID=218684 /ORGANISM="Corethron pennatum, Strain L29A3" /LENGTH=501 /DNA_ID=CAMNT_0039070883 /DNA_START=101 /DNA_END=1606 /DNA_ORIENTATION=+
MEQALQNYERATQEAITNFRAAWEAERDKLSRERRHLKEDRARFELEAAEGRRALESDRAAFVAEIASFAAVKGTVVLPADRVLLNVGGKHFETTRRTLTAAMDRAPDSLLGAMFSGRWRLQPDEERRIFIERNGAMFEYILDFLRAYSTGDENAAFPIHALPETQMAVMWHELEYYGLESVVFPLVPFSLDVAIFSPGPKMLSKRCGLGAVVLPENRGVLVVGGQDGREHLASTELLDIETQKFSSGSSMESRRSGCAAVVLEDGKVIVVGGYYNGTVLSTSEVLNPATDTWSPGPNMTSGRHGCAALALSDARILVIGGISYDTNVTFSLSTTEILDLSTEISTPGPEMSCTRNYCSVVMLHDGRVLVIGGQNSTANNLSTTEVLDLSDGTSSPGPEMNIARCATSATLLSEDGQVLVIGGRGINGADLATTEVLDVAGNTTSAGPKLGITRSFCVAVKLPEDRILVIGGLSDNTEVSTCEVLGMPMEKGQQQKRCRLT